MLSPRRLPIRRRPRLSLRRGRRIARKEEEEEVGREIVDAHAPGEVGLDDDGVEEHRQDGRRGR
jgi:hypothetical protein